MSISARIVIPVSFQKVYDIPYAKTSSDRNDQSLQCSDRTCKKSHINSTKLAFQIFTGMENAGISTDAPVLVIPFLIIFHAITYDNLGDSVILQILMIKYGILW